MADKKLRLQWIQEQAELTTLNPKTNPQKCELTLTHSNSYSQPCVRKTLVV